MATIALSRASTRRERENSPLVLPSAYYSAVDGLRAIAILSVLAFHTGLYANGLFGVDVFFVLSGYLITLTLLREHHRTGTVSLGRFYIRRAKRLLPLLVLMLAASLVAILVWGLPRELTRFGEQALASLVYVANWEQIAAGQGYWEHFGAINPLGHMWSLAITEQFYVVWPFVIVALLFCGRVWARKSGEAYSWQRSRVSAGLVLAVSGLGIGIGSFLTSTMFDGSNADRVYMGTDTHFVGLVAGAAGAAITYLHLQRRSGSGSEAPSPTPAWSALVTLLSGGTLAAIVILSVNASSYTAEWLYSYGFTTVAVLATVLVLTLTSTSNKLSRVFAMPPLVGLGKVSYTLFLIHLPVFWFVSSVAGWSQPIDLFILGIPASIVLALALHHLVGEPLRKRSWSRKGVVAFVAAMALIAGAVVAAPAIKASSSAGAGATRVLLLGDSLSHDFAEALSYYPDDFTVVDGGFNGCGIAGSIAQRPQGVDEPWATAPGCNPWEDRWRAELVKAGADVVVVNLAWDAITQVYPTRETDLLDSSFATEYRGALARAVDMLERTGATIYFVKARYYNWTVTPAQAATFNSLLEEAVRDYPSVHLLDLGAAVCDADECRAETATGEAMYVDDRVHFSDAGKREISQSLADSIRDVPSGTQSRG